MNIKKLREKLRKKIDYPMAYVVIGAGGAGVVFLLIAGYKILFGE